MTDRDPWIDGIAKLSGRTYDQERALWDSHHPEPSRDWSTEVEDRLERRHGGEGYCSDRAADRYERWMEGAA